MFITIKDTKGINMNELKPYKIEFEEEYNEGGYTQYKHFDKSFDSMPEVIDELNKREMARDPGGKLSNGHQFTNGTTHCSIQKLQ